MTNRYVCDRCGSENIIKKGFVSGKQRFQCKECKKTFFGTRKNRRKAQQEPNEPEPGQKTVRNIFDMYKRHFNP